MTTIEKLNVGIAGSCGRGRSFKLACDSVGGVRIHAVCDINQDKLHESAEQLGAVEEYTDFDEMLTSSELDAVIIATPMPCHASQTIAALKHGLHVLSEVPACVSVEECRQVTEAQHAAGKVYMMAENYTYIRSNVIIREIVRRGEFGAPYYAEGEYLHELKGLNEITRWRRKWQAGINGVTYGTHSLGPILQWMPGDRVVSVCCAGGGHRYRDPRGDLYETESSTVMLCRMRSGGLVKIRVDMLSDRPHAMTNYQLQGTDGAYESARAKGEINRIWLRTLSPTPDKWTDLQALEDSYLPDYWRTGIEIAAKAGHGGGDYFEILDFFDAIAAKRPTPIGVHEAMDMTLPGLISQQSILQDSAWLDVPDSRDWVKTVPAAAG